MITIYGKYTNAIVYNVANEEYALEDYARKQIQMICNHPSSKNSIIRIMPDVHPGKVGTIGLTMTVGYSLMPSLIGVDIGCGMTVARIKARHIEYQKLDTLIREKIPVGGNIRKNSHKFADKTHIDKMHCADKADILKAYKSIGTLGGGNHFIELDKDENNNIYLVVHSGSRHLGMEVTDYYLRSGQLEQQMKKQGGHAPYELTCLQGKLLQDYLDDLKIMQEFAAINREAIIDEIVRGMKWKVIEEYSCIHNYVDFEDEVAILRKGAISAKKDEKVIIPINMKDGIILGTGLGNKEWNNSAPHGSGRVYRRSEVKEHHTLSEFKKEMKGIHSVCINKDTLDEAPFAYRRIEDILPVIKETVEVTSVLKPVYNYKAGGTN